MKYLKFEIKNFKWIKWPLIIDLTSPTNIFPLVWLNESGKTSILEAINFFSTWIFNNNAYKLIHKEYSAWFTGEIAVTATVELDDSDLNKIYSYAKTKNVVLDPIGNKIQIKRCCSFKDSIMQDNNRLRPISLTGKIWKSKKSESLDKKDKWKHSDILNYIANLLPDILYHPNFLYNFPEKIYLDEVDFLDDNYDRQQEVYREVLQDILTYCDSSYNIETHLLSRLKDGSPQMMSAAESTLLRISNALNQQILWRWKNIFSLDNQDRKIIAKYASENTWEKKRFFVSFQVEQADGIYLISERSLWFRRFFSFLLFTEFRKVRSDNSGQLLFLLDEPASNLHQNCQKQLLALFREISANTKIVYSTHSHHLIDPRDLLSTYIVRNTAMSYEGISIQAGNTNIEALLYKNFVAAHNDQKSHYQPILNALDYSESYLEQTDKIVYLEWKNDYYTFKYMAYLLTEEEDSVYFYPWASVDKYEPILRLGMATNKSYICLFDGDHAWGRAKNNYIKNLWDELLTRIFTLKDIEPEIFSWFTTEDLFSEGDKLAITKLLFPGENKFDKSKFNAGIQHLYITRERFKLSEQTLENFKKIFDFIGNKLWNSQN